jgi:AAA15 family ATPase/GTPase
MLVEFSVANFRSIKERQKLSMVAGASAARQTQHSMDSGNSFAPYLLRSACIFGPNGSGKTSLVRALSFFQRFVTSSSKSASDGDEISLVPFKPDERTRNAPSEFEIMFIFEGALYQYGFTADRHRIYEEWLFSRSSEKSSRMRNVFQRAYNSEIEQYEWEISDDLVKGERETWKKATRSNALFLSTAVQLNSDSLLSPYRWIDLFLRVLTSPDRLDVNITARYSQDEKGKAKVLSLFQAFGLPIAEFEISERQISISEEMSKVFRADFLESLKDVEAGPQYEVDTFHRSGDELIKYDLKEESDGTRVIFSLAGPLLETTSHGFTLVVDELHNSLHPIALRFLVELFHDATVNQSGAQLIFTSHDTAVMSRGFLHRDQVWLVDRSETDGSSLIPLSDFNVREMQSFQRAYLGGKFGALPRVKRAEIGQK